MLVAGIRVPSLNWAMQTPPEAHSFSCYRGGNNHRGLYHRSLFHFPRPFGTSCTSYLDVDSASQPWEVCMCSHILAKTAITGYLLTRHTHTQHTHTHTQTHTHTHTHILLYTHAVHSGLAGLVIQHYLITSTDCPFWLKIQNGSQSFSLLGGVSCKPSCPSHLWAMPPPIPP